MKTKKNKIKNAKLRVAITMALLSCSGANVFAQAVENNGNDDPTIEEIVVTATRRAESIQEVPLSVSAITLKKIEREGIREFADYGIRVPNLSFSQSNSSSAANSLSISLRGVNGGNTTGFYIDDTPLAEGLNPRVTNLERIEVLRGPQGTLFGARSLGGTVRLITKKPDTTEFSGQLRVAGESMTDGDNSYLYDGSVNIAVSDDIAFTVLGYKQSMGGFIDIKPDGRAVVSGDPSRPLLTETLKDVNSEDVEGYQVSGLFEFMDDKLKIMPRFMSEKTTFDGRSQADVSATSSLDGRASYRFFDLPEVAVNDWTLGTLTFSYDADYGQFTSASSWFDRDSKDSEDGSLADFAGLLVGIPNQPLLPFLQFLDPAFPAFPEGALSPVSISVAANSESFTQEFRFVSDWSGNLQLTAGLFYSDSQGEVNFPVTALPPIPGEFLDLFSQSSSSDVQEIALYMESTYAVNDQLNIIVGGRYFENDVALVSFQGGTFGSGLTVADTQSETGFNPRFGMQYKINEDHNFYATASEGFRLGGPNVIPFDLCQGDIVNLGLDPDSLQSYKSDSITSYEMGLKSDLMNGRLRVNSAVYKIDWKDIQQGIGLQCGFGATVNVGQAEIFGAEIEVQYQLSDNTTISVGTGYTDSEITDNGGLDGLIAIGSKIQDVPQVTFNTSIDSHFDLFETSFFSYLSYTYVGDSDGRPQLGVASKRDSYSIANFRIGAELENTTISLYINNLTDEIADFGNKPPLALDTPGLKRSSINRPRTIGVEMRYYF
ncbi:MAG: TonB-dependent receptor [Pseudomonadota bacterium]